MSLGVLYKGPDEATKYGMDWADWLDVDRDGTADDSIATATWALDTGLTAGATANTTTVATIIVSGGAIGGVYKARCTITTTSSSETFDRYFEIHVVDQ